MMRYKLSRFERVDWLKINKPELIDECNSQDACSSMIGDKSHHSKWLDKQNIPKYIKVDPNKLN